MCLVLWKMFALMFCYLLRLGVLFVGLVLLFGVSCYLVFLCFSCCFVCCMIIA